MLLGTKVVVDKVNIRMRDRGSCDSYWADSMVEDSCCRCYWSCMMRLWGGGNSMMYRGKEMGGRCHMMGNWTDMVRCRANMMGGNFSMMDSSAGGAKVMMDKRCSSGYSMVNRVSWTLMMEHS